VRRVVFRFRSLRHWPRHSISLGRPLAGDLTDSFVKKTMEESDRSEQLSKTAIQVAWFTTGKQGGHRVNTNIQLTGWTERLDLPERLLREEDARDSGASA
jgi:hypothetical protein